MKKTTRRLLSFILTWILVLGMMPDMSLYVQAAATDDDAVEVDWSAGDPDDAYEVYALEGGTYGIKLLKNIETATGIDYYAYSELDLNGYGIRYNGNSNSFNLTRSVVLKDTYVGSARAHYITVDEKGRGISVKNTGTESDTCFKVTGGYITGCTGGAIKLDSASDYFEMNGGTIIGNTASSGAAVYVMQGQVIIYGGMICHNVASYEGAIYFMMKLPGSEHEAEFTMNGGMICNNKAPNGGGVYMHDGEFVMNGGMICDNEAEYGGGVYLDTYSSFTMEDGTISGNSSSKNGGGICSNGEDKTIIHGGTITDNTAGFEGHGGGISGGVTISGSPVIKDNKSGNHTENIFLYEGSKLKLDGDLGDDADIGVTTAANPAEDAPVDFIDNTGNFGITGKITSDNEEYSMEIVDGKPVLTNLPTPKFEKVPAAKEMKYNGSDQALVEAGTVNRGKVLYALGQNAETEPAADKYTETVPVAKDAGDYYIWYKIDINTDRKGAVKSTIATKEINDENTKITFAYELHENGEEQEQKIKSVKVEDMELVAGTDYSIDPDSHLKETVAGEYSVSITGKGNYSGKVHANWLMEKADIIASPDQDFDENYDPMNPVPDMDIDKKSQTIYLVEGQKFTATMLAGWTVDKADKKYLTVSSKGVVKAKKAKGKITIINPDETKTVSINICKPFMEEKKITVEAGKGRAIPFAGKNENLQERWFSSNQDVATVDFDGRVTGIAKGKAVITVYVNGKAYKCTVTVTETKPAATRTLHLTQNGAAKKLTIKGVKKLKWTVSDNDADKVKITKGTSIKGLKAGVVSLNAVDKKTGETYKATVYIEDPTLKIEGIEGGKKNKYTLEIKRFTMKQIRFAEIYQDVLFISNKPEYAHDMGSGVIIAMKTGKAKLKAKINSKTVTVTVNVVE